MRKDAFEIQYRPGGSPRRKVRFEPRSRGAGEWVRVVFEWTGCTWRHVGEEPVQDVTLERDAEILDESSDGEATDVEVTAAVERDQA